MLADCPGSFINWFVSLISMMMMIDVYTAAVGGDDDYDKYM